MDEDCIIPNFPLKSYKKMNEFGNNNEYYYKKCATETSISLLFFKKIKKV